MDKLAQLNPAEVLYPNDCQLPTETINTYWNQRNPKEFRLSSSITLLKEQFKVDQLESFGADNKPLASCAAGALLNYLQLTQKSSLAHITNMRFDVQDKYLHVPATTLRHLEITTSSQNGPTLYSILRTTKTPMGTRLLKFWLERPIKSHEHLNQRYDAIEAFSHPDWKSFSSPC